MTPRLTDKGRELARIERERQPDPRRVALGERWEQRQKDKSRKDSEP